MSGLSSLPLSPVARPMVPSPAATGARPTTTVVAAGAATGERAEVGGERADAGGERCSGAQSVVARA